MLLKWPQNGTGPCGYYKKKEAIIAYCTTQQRTEQIEELRASKVSILNTIQVFSDGGQVGQTLVEEVRLNPI